MIVAALEPEKVVEYAAKHRLEFKEHLCKGCNLCVWVCPAKVLKLDIERVNGRGYNPAVCNNIDGCIACGMCAVICPDSVIKVERDV